MLNKQLFKCDQNCEKCQSSCELKPDTVNMTDFFERIISELGIMDLNIVVHLIQIIDSINDSDSKNIMFIPTCIEAIIKPLLLKLNEKDSNVFKINTNINDFLYHISNKIIELNKKRRRK